MNGWARSRLDVQYGPNTILVRGSISRRADPTLYILEGGLHLLLRRISLGLVISVRHRRIRAFSGVRSDTCESIVFPALPGDLSATLAR